MGTYTIVGWCGYRLACGVVGSIHDQKRGKKMLLTSDGYSLTYYKNRNQIVIGLPQTWSSLTNTLQPVVDRRIDVTEQELDILLRITKLIFLNKERSEDAETN